MGCGVSRPAINEDAPVPPGLSPIRRRIEEIKRNRKSHKRSKSHLSSKELLDDDDHLMDDEDDGRKSVSSYRLESIEEVDQGTHFKSYEREVSFTPPSKNVLDVVVVVEKKEEHQEKEEEEDEEDEEGNRLSYGSDFGPGSPSFREYCVFSADTDHSVDSGEIGKDDSKSDEEKREGRHQRKGSIVSSEGYVTVLVKKEHKGRRFKRVLPKGGQIAVKNLLNVRGCYCSNPQLAPAPTA